MRVVRLAPNTYGHKPLLERPPRGKRVAPAMNALSALKSLQELDRRAVAAELRSRFEAGGSGSAPKEPTAPAAIGDRRRRHRAAYGRQILAVSKRSGISGPLGMAD